MQIPQIPSVEVSIGLKRFPKLSNLIRNTDLDASSFDMNICQNRRTLANKCILVVSGQPIHHRLLLSSSIVIMKTILTGKSCTTTIMSELDLYHEKTK